MDLPNDSEFYQELLSTPDNTLSEEQRCTLDEHLRHCVACARFREESIVLRSALERLPIPNMEPGLPPHLEELIAGSRNEDDQQRFQELKHHADSAEEDGDDRLHDELFASALDKYVEALDRYRLLESRPDEARVLEKIANIQDSLQDVDTAISMGKEVGLYRKGGGRKLAYVGGTEFGSHQGQSAVLDTPAQYEIIAAESSGVIGGTPLLPSYHEEDEAPDIANYTGKVFPKQGVPRRRILYILLILIVLVGGGGVAATPLSMGKSHSSCATAPNQLPTSAHGIGVVQTDAGECIGLSDGTVAFDVDQPGRTDSALKQQAAQKLAAGDRKDAIDLLQQAVKQDKSDAEALIYREDLRLLESGQPYFTLIIGTKITGEHLNPTGERNNLQGAFIAQQEHNTNCTPPCMAVRFLIANTGNDANNAKTVVSQIVQAEQFDRTIIGVDGWSVSQDSVNMVSTLTAEHLPMVSPAASSDWLTGISLYFFRVAPPDSSQGVLAASYAMNTLHASRIALFIDQSNAYSSSLASAFKQHITSGSVDVETYTVGTYAQNKDLARTNLQNVLSYHPDLIYFAGYQKDAAALLEELSTYKSLAQLPVMGGDALEDLVSGPNQNVAGLDHLVFTDFASPDEWQYVNPSVQKPPFFQEYAQIFASGEINSGEVNGDNSPSGAAILSYDAIRVFLQASQNAFVGKNAPLTGQDLQKALKRGLLTGQDLQQALTHITGSHAFQGVGGQIAFGSDGNPSDKAVVILKVNEHGKARIIDVKGTFRLQ